MPNLLKSLPREILENQDAKFIYNVLNPLLFNKIKETDTDTIVTHTVASLMNKDINLKGKFLQEFTLPVNLNSSEFHVYMADGQENKKLEYIGKTELVKELDDLKDYIFFYFSIPGYAFIHNIVKKYYYVVNEFEKNKKLYEYNFNQYLEAKEIRKKKVFKSTYEHFKNLYDEFDILKDQFDILFTEASKYREYGVSNIVDNFAKQLGFSLKIKTFDNEIIFEKSKLFDYLGGYTNNGNVNKHIYSGKNVISTSNVSYKNAFELFAIFAMEFSNIKEKYDEYLKLLVDNGMGYSFDRSEHKRLKNTKQKDILLNLESDNLTYFIDEINNKLEIYLYFNNSYKIDESTILLNVNNERIPTSINSLNGYYNYGYSLFEYFDDTAKYYKITVHNFLRYSLDEKCVNYDITDINIKFDVVQSNYKLLTNPHELYIETNKFVDNFEIYGKNEKTGFFEKLNVPFKIKVSIQDKDDMYARSFELSGINDSSKNILSSQTETIIGYYDYDYVFEPKIYVDFFKHIDNIVKFRYNTVMPYVLIDDVIDGELDINYYYEVDDFNLSTNIYKNIIMDDGKTYKKMYDDVDCVRLMNPYNESNYNFVSKISYEQYNNRNHVSSTLIDSQIQKVPFIDNLKYLDKFQYDHKRDVIILMYRNKQLIIPLNEGIVRGLNYENIYYTATDVLEYHGFEMTQEPFVYTDTGIYLKNHLTGDYDIIEAVPSEKLNLVSHEKEIFFDIHEMSHCIIIDKKKYKVEGLYIDTYKNVYNLSNRIMYVESKYGIPRYKSLSGKVVDVDFSCQVIVGSGVDFGKIYCNLQTKKLTYLYSANEIYELNLIELEIKQPKHRQLGMNAFSIFYAGNTLPENTNKSFVGRENIYNSMLLPDNIYKMGRGGDLSSDTQKHALISEQLDLNLVDSKKYNLEHEPYIMFKSGTSSFKGLESYLKSNLKSISQNIVISPVYLIQRNRFISEWSRVSSILPNNEFAASTLKDLVSDLMETKLLNNGYDDLIDIFKNNEFEKFSMDTNNVHSVLVQYILREVEENNIFESLSYYLTHEVWIKNNRKKIIDFIKENSKDDVIKKISNLSFNLEIDKVSLFNTFTDVLSRVKKQTIESYIPIGNYSDWDMYIKNNKVKFEKPFKYEVIDISDFITMPIEWEFPLYMIRPLIDDGVTVSRDFRFLDLSIATNSQVTYDDAYNEYVDNVKNKLNRPVDYLFETLQILSDLSISHGFDMMGINFVVIKWMVERFIPLFMTTHDVTEITELVDGIKVELMSAEHPNMIISYNKIKESTFLSDFGYDVKSIYDSIVHSNLLINTVIRLDITSSTELDYLDKVKKPLEHYFDYLFFVKRHDIITKILALFTEDVIATSMIDLSMAINIKNAKGDQTFDVYENMVYAIFDEFLPFHTVLDKIIFAIKIMETSSGEAVGKQIDTKVKDNSIISVMLDFVEKIKIHTLDNLKTIIGNTRIYSEGMIFSGSHGDIPYDYDRRVKVAGYDIPAHMDDTESYGMDDEWYIVDVEKWRRRTQDITDPPEFAEYGWLTTDIGGELEKIADTYISDYYHIKTNIFERGDVIESHFVDGVPVIDINQGVTDNPEINVTEDYLISIESNYKIQFYDMELIGHDEYGVDSSSGPENQTTLIGMKEGIRQHILNEFYDKVNISFIDSVWTDVCVVYDFVGIPGHDEFAIDEDYHQSSPNKLEHEVSTMVYDDLLQTGFNINHTDMSDVSLVDNKLASIVYHEYNDLLLNTVVKDVFVVSVNIFVNRNFDKDGRFVRPGHDEFVYDEYYHSSADNSRLLNMVDTLIVDYIDNVRIDFGFMRMLPFDPYVDLINQKFYRANQPGSDTQTSRIRDKFSNDIHSLYKDIVRVGLMDFYTLDVVATDVRRKIYEGIEIDSFGGDSFTSSIADSLIKRNIHHDFRENIIAIEKFASILSDTDIISIYGSKSANIERDSLFTLELSDKFYTSIKIKAPVDRVRTKIDKDYLKSIKVEEENFVEFKYMDDNILVRFSDMMHLLFTFNEKSNVSLSSNEKNIVSQFNNEKQKISILDNVMYGNHHGFVIDGMYVGGTDKLLQSMSNKIHQDSMVLSLTDSTFTSFVFDDYNFDIRSSQPHADYGHMGYTDESMNRSIETKFTDSLIQVSKDMRFDSSMSKIYDTMMYDVRNDVRDYIDVVISETLKTYIDIVKKPWVMAEFDNFGHNEHPHVYSGYDDEFDISTQLLETIKLDTYTTIYDNNVLVMTHDRIFTGHNHNIPEKTISVSMKDDLKILSVGFKELSNVKTTDIQQINKNLVDQQLKVGVHDNLWYGYKMQDDVLNISIRESVYYAYLDEITNYHDVAHTKIADWLLFKYKLNSDFLHVDFNDDLKHYGFGSSYSDITDIVFKEKLSLHEYFELSISKELSKIQINDTLYVGKLSKENPFENIVAADLFYNEKTSIKYNEKIEYGRGRKFNEPLMVFGANKIYTHEQYNGLVPKINTVVNDKFEFDVLVETFKDKFGISTYERIKFGPIFKDKSNISVLDRQSIKYSWLNKRYGVDQIPHSDNAMEYYDESADRQLTTETYDDIKIIDVHMYFGDFLDILTTNNVIVQNSSSLPIDGINDSIIITNNDTLMYGIGTYDGVWDSKLWPTYGYTVPYEGWKGHVPHDDFPHDYMEHSDQGNDLSQIKTGIVENLMYGFDFIFKDMLHVTTSDVSGFESWEYQSVFKEIINTQLRNSIGSVIVDEKNPNVFAKFKNESMTVSYSFDDKVKTHKFISLNDEKSMEEINIYTFEHHQLLETIMRYRFYESIDVIVNDDLLTTCLFKYDDDLSLITDYSTRINLYKTQSDGSLSKSMTIIQDKSTAKIELLFSDGISASIKEKLQGTESYR